jgi:hypothetical protein
MVALAYSWEGQVGCYPSVQFLTPGSTLLLDEIQMLDPIKVLWQANKLERVHTYRHLQAVSHAISQLFKGERDIDFFKLPQGIVVRPNIEGEVRCVKKGVATDEAFLINRASGVGIPCCVDASVDIPLLVEGLDQGGECTADHAYSRSDMEVMRLPKWDKIHRLIRDMKGVYSKANGGIWHKAQLLRSLYTYLQYTNTHLPTCRRICPPTQ